MRRTAAVCVAVLMLGLAAVVTQLSVVALVQGEDLRTHPGNTRAAAKAFARQRGEIRTSDGEVIAVSVPVAEPGRGDDTEQWVRTYPHGELYAHLAGYLSAELGAVGLEATHNDVLTGPQDRPARRLLGSGARIGARADVSADVVASVRHSLQLVARAALGDRNGAVIAVAPAGGQILALWSNPSFDPNVLATSDTAAARRFFAALQADSQMPLSSSAAGELYALQAHRAPEAAFLDAAVAAGTSGLDQRREPQPRRSGDVWHLTLAQLAAAATGLVAAEQGRPSPSLSAAAADGLPQVDAAAPVPAMTPDPAVTDRSTQPLDAAAAAQLLDELSAGVSIQRFGPAAPELRELDAAVAAGGGQAGSSVAVEWAVAAVPRSAPRVVVAVLAEVGPAHKTVTNDTGSGTVAVSIARIAVEAELARPASP